MNGDTLKAWIIEAVKIVSKLFGGNLSYIIAVSALLG